MLARSAGADTRGAAFRGLVPRSSIRDTQRRRLHPQTARQMRRRYFRRPDRPPNAASRIDNGPGSGTIARLKEIPVPGVPEFAEFAVVSRATGVRYRQVSAGAGRVVGYGACRQIDQHRIFVVEHEDKNVGVAAECNRAGKLVVQSHSAAAHGPIQGRTRQRQAGRVPRARQQCERLAAGARIWGRRVAADRKYPEWPALRLIKGVSGR